MRFKIHSSYNHRGGADAMHMLCGELSAQGQYAAMVYEPEADPLPILEPFASMYGIANRETRKENRDEEDTVQVMPAGWGPNWYQYDPDTPSCLKFSGEGNYRSTKVMYWLGIGIWQDWEREVDAPIDPSHPNLKRCLHACGSQRAYDFLVNSGEVDPSTVFFLRDFTDPLFIHGEEEIAEAKREAVVLYNPTKGMEHTERIMALLHGVRFIPLVNMSHQQMRDWGLRSRVYIDFGPFGGREKMHREMSVCGCTVITGDEGSSANPIDVPNGRRKFHRLAGHYDYLAVREQVLYDLKNHRDAITEPHMVAYREGVRSERHLFRSDVGEMIALISTANNVQRL